jgi:hypothetical protein
VWADKQEPDMRRDVSRDELARDNEVPHSPRERFVNQAAMHRRYCNLPWEGLLYANGSWLNVEQSTLIVEEKSAEGIVAVETSRKGCYRRKCGGLTRRRSERFVRGNTRYV